MTAGPPSRDLRRRIPPLGMPALAAFAVCAATGIMLAPAYQPGAPLDSLALLLLKNPAGVFVRSLHYWSAQAFFVLTLAHTVDHLLRRSEARVRFGVWLRLGLSVPVVAGALLSGFLLRADAAALQALPILRTLLGFLPLAGSALARILTGSGSDLTTVYLHHVCTATILIWLVTVDHARRLVPSPRSFWWTLLPLLPLSLLLAPGLEWRPAGVEIGPWYLAGLQEFLHWLPQPPIALWLALAGLTLLILLPKFPPPLRSRLKQALAAAAFAYAALTVVALGFRGDGWKWELPAWNGAPEFLSYKIYLPPEATLAAAIVPLVAGRREGCLACHKTMTGFSPAHAPTLIGCAACHEGNPFTLNQTLAHAGMSLTPGNLSSVNRTCATSNCHLNVALRIRASLMNTMSGVVAVDKFVFGEARDPNLHFDVAALAHSPADSHLRNLCASCHLGLDKPKPAPIDELSRGGGCSACHLFYDPASAAELRRRPFSSAPLHHPGISLHIPEEACFGCHSRSGRISLSYAGWHETLLDQPPANPSGPAPVRYRLLADGRVLEKHSADIHFEKGMSCIDCHVAAEVMGSASTPAAAPAHASAAIKISCLDCHSPAAPALQPFARLEAESQTIAALRKLNQPGRLFLVSPSGAAYTNAFVDPGHAPASALKESGRLLTPKPRSAACTRAASLHPRLDCGACHSAWAPQCVTCHTSFDPAAPGWDHLDGAYSKGAWQERAADFLAGAPSLGVVRAPLAGGTTAERVTTFAPGMVLDLQLPSRAPAPHSRFQRLFAPVSPHTTSARSRTCLSCHADPNALGYGRGKLTYAVNQGAAAWQFTPAFPAADDGLPRDAWTGFLRPPRPESAALVSGRPFTLAEQRSILLVGACLQCHSENEPRLAPVFAHFETYRSALSPKCILPAWAGSAPPSPGRAAIKPEVSSHVH